MTTNPSEEEVLYILRPLRHIEPSLGVHKVLAILKERNPSWILSEKRLRDIMKRYGLETVAAAASLSAVPEQYNIGPPPFEQSDPRPHPKGWSVTLEASYEKVRPLQPFVRGQFLGPFDWSKVDAKKRGYKMMAFAKPGRGFSDALLHQLDYKANSDRIYRLYGSGGWDWGFTPNADMRILFDVCNAAQPYGSCSDQDSHRRCLRRLWRTKIQGHYTLCTCACSQPPDKWTSLPRISVLNCMLSACREDTSQAPLADSPLPCTLVGMGLIPSTLLLTRQRRKRKLLHGTNEMNATVLRIARRR